MNNVNLIGRMTKDSELKDINGYKICTFTLAVQRPVQKDKERESDFINCVAYGKTGELINQYIRKGEQLGITGKIRTSSYEKDGHKYYSTGVVVDQLHFIGNKKDEAKVTTEPSNTPAENKPKDAFEEFASEIELDDSMLPF